MYGTRKPVCRRCFASVPRLRPGVATRLIMSGFCVSESDVSGDFRVGPWLVQPGLNTVSHNGTSLRLEPKVMEVLVCLADRPGQTIAKQALLNRVWPDTF